ncbi:MAG TPA: hypothetical protein VKY45_04100 [Marinilabiliaceae bacterium]|nr:hypothetical protein [Marinilabiliaceae bacterium]
MRSYFLLVFTFILSLCAQAQEQWDIPNVTRSWKDVLGNYYFEINQESLYKTDEQGHFIAEKPASRAGKIASVDVSNPFKIKVYYPRVKTIHILDNDLSVLQKIDLRSFMDWDIKAVGSTKDGMLILLDTYHQQWIRMDEHGNHAILGVPFEHLKLDWDDYVDLEMNESFWALIFEDQVYVFDVYGAYMNAYPVAAGQSVQLYDGFLYFLEPGQLIEENLRRLSRKSIALSIEGDWEGWRVERNRLILHYPKYILFKTLE